MLADGPAEAMLFISNVIIMIAGTLPNTSKSPISKATERLKPLFTNTTDLFGDIIVLLVAMTLRSSWSSTLVQVAELVPAPAFSASMACGALFLIENPNRYRVPDYISNTLAVEYAACPTADLIQQGHPIAKAGATPISLYNRTGYYVAAIDAVIFSHVATILHSPLRKASGPRRCRMTMKVKNLRSRRRVVKISHYELQAPWKDGHRTVDETKILGIK
jgi:hypothetical protein